ncbi:PD40 domain-containing protein [Candidatus Dependentiae bacterium]|nr:PD40 domain-containing protein [Candidatus Dependentiae bacterium]
MDLMSAITNSLANGAYRMMNLQRDQMLQHQNKISSGKRINSASDDAAGLAISKKFETQTRGLQQANRNVQDGISMLQTLEGGLGGIHDILQRMRSLAVQSANDTLTNEDRNLIQLEINELIKEIDRKQTSCEFNTIKLLKGVFNNPKLGEWNQITQLNGSSIAGFDVSTDGKLITFSSNKDDGITSKLYVMNSDGSNIKKLTDFPSYMSKFTPDNENITFTGIPPGETLREAMMISVDGNNLTNLSNTPLSAESYSQVSPDGNTVIWSQSGNLIKSDFPDLNPSATGNVIGNWFNYFPSGDKIIYHRNVVTSWEIFIADLEGNVLQQVTNNSLSDLVYGNGISPDESKIVFSRHSSNSSTDDTGELYMMNIDGSELTRLTDNNSFEGLSQLSEDGKKLYFVSNKTGAQEIYTAEMEYDGLFLHAGANMNQTIELKLDNMSSYALGIRGLSVETQTQSEAALGLMDNAINKVSAYRAKIGALQNRLEHTFNYNGAAEENQTSAKSRIEDADIAREMIEYTKRDMLDKISMSMLSQANLKQKNILNLFQ